MVYQSLPQSECYCRLLSKFRVDPSLSLKGHDALGLYMPSWMRHSGGLLSEFNSGISAGLSPPRCFQSCAELPDGSGGYSWPSKIIPSDKDTRLLFKKAEQIQVLGLTRGSLMLCIKISPLCTTLVCTTALDQASHVISRRCEYLKTGYSSASMLSEKLPNQQVMLKTGVTHNSCSFTELSPAQPSRWCLCPLLKAGM